MRLRNTVLEKCLNKETTGKSYADIAEDVNHIYGTHHTKESIRSIWRRYGTKTHTQEFSSTPVLDEGDITDWEDYVKLKVNGNYLIIGDTHLPFMQAGYLEFLYHTSIKYDCKTVFHIGDFVDMYALSAFDKSPQADNVVTELLKAIDMAKDFYRLFPNCYMTDGNHDRRYLTRAAKSGYPKMFLKTLEEVLEMPNGWHINHSYIVNGDTLIEHGTNSGMKATYDKAILTSLNVAQGHTHHYGGVLWVDDGITSRWALNVGCGVNHRSYALKYAKDFKLRPTLGCGVVVDGVPMFIPFRG